MGSVLHFSFCGSFRIQQALINKSRLGVGVRTPDEFCFHQHYSPMSVLINEKLVFQFDLASFENCCMMDNGKDQRRLRDIVFSCNNECLTMHEILYYIFIDNVDMTFIICFHYVVQSLSMHRNIL